MFHKLCQYSSSRGLSKFGDTLHLGANLHEHLTTKIMEKYENHKQMQIEFCLHRTKVEVGELTQVLVIDTISIQ